MELELLRPDREIESPSCPPVIFVHGTHHGAWVWRDWINYFAANNILSYALSLRGHGGSKLGVQLQDVGILDYVDDLGIITQNLKQPPILIGHSMGCFVILKYLEKFQEASAAVLIAPSPDKHPLRHTLLAHVGLVLRGRSDWVRAMKNQHITSTVDYTRLALLSELTDKTVVEDYHSKLLRESESVNAFLDILLGRVQLELSKITCPLLVIGGGRDRIIPLRSVRSFAKRTGATLEMIPNAGHSMIVDTCWMKIADKTIEWIQTQDFKTS